MVQYSPLIDLSFAPAYALDVRAYRLRFTVQDKDKTQPYGLPWTLNKARLLKPSRVCERSAVILLCSTMLRQYKR